MRRITIALPLITTLVFVAGLFLQANEARKSPAMSNLEAVNVVRAANTMELRYKHQENTFATLDELIAMHDAAGANFKTLKQQNPLGYMLSVITSPDGLHYVLSLKASAVNGRSFFSDDAGLIYEGAPIR